MKRWPIPIASGLQRLAAGGDLLDAVATASSDLIGYLGWIGLADWIAGDATAPERRAVRRMLAGGASSAHLLGVLRERRRVMESRVRSSRRHDVVAVVAELDGESFGEVLERLAKVRDIVDGLKKGHGLAHVRTQETTRAYNLLLAAVARLSFLQEYWLIGCLEGSSELRWLHAAQEAATANALGVSREWPALAGSVALLAPDRRRLDLSPWLQLAPAPGVDGVRLWRLRALTKPGQATFVAFGSAATCELAAVLDREKLTKAPVLDRPPPVVATVPESVRLTPVGDVPKPIVVEAVEQAGALPGEPVIPEPAIAPRPPSRSVSRPIPQSAPPPGFDSGRRGSPVSPVVATPTPLPEPKPRSKDKRKRPPSSIFGRSKAAARAEPASAEVSAPDDVLDDDSGSPFDAAAFDTAVFDAPEQPPDVPASLSFGSGPGAPGSGGSGPGASGPLGFQLGEDPFAGMSEVEEYAPIASEDAGPGGGLYAVEGLEGDGYGESAFGPQPTGATVRLAGPSGREFSSPSPLHTRRSDAWKLPVAVVLTLALLVMAALHLFGQPDVGWMPGSWWRELPLIQDRGQQLLRYDRDSHAALVAAVVTGASEGLLEGVAGRETDEAHHTRDRVAKIHRATLGQTAASRTPGDEVRSVFTTITFGDDRLLSGYLLGRHAAVVGMGMTSTREGAPWSLLPSTAPFCLADWVPAGCHSQQTCRQLLRAADRCFYEAATGR